MNEKKSRRGLGRVYGFTLRRTFLAKANIASLVLFVVLIAAAVPVYSRLNAAAPVNAAGEQAAAGLLESAGVTQDMRAVLEKPVYSDGARIGGEQTDTFALAYAASILVMFISVFASGYIVRSVTEEKVSRLAETLIVSVDPFMLALGKILAVLTYVAVSLGAMIAAFAASYAVTGRLMDVSPVTALIGSLLSSLENANAATAAISAVMLILGVAGFANLAALTGAGCVTVEDTGNAMGVPTLLIMICYMVSIFASTMTPPAWLCLIPFLSVFITPVQYLSGNVSFAVMAISWALQAAVTLLLLWLCGRVYRGLILYNGSRLKFFKILSVALRRGKEGA